VATSERPKPAGLFLRYCAACNSTQTVAERGKSGLACGECGGAMATVDAHALIPALGTDLSPDLRADALKRCADHTLPRAT